MTRIRQLVLDLPARPAFGREDFYVTPANGMALSQIDAWPNWPDGRLAVVGPKGAGKTHLAHVWAARADAVMLPAVDLAQAGPEPVAAEAAVIIEDVDRIADLPGDAVVRAEEALFHLLNRLHAGGGSVLVTGQGAPATWLVRLPDLASRLATAAVAQVVPPDDDLLSAVLVKLFADRQVSIPDDVVPFVLVRMERSFGAALDLVDRLDRAALSLKRPISVRLAAEVMRSGAGMGGHCTRAASA